MKNSTAQILTGIIIVLIVAFVGFLFVSDGNEEDTCLDKTQVSLNKFAESIENAVNKGTASSFVFSVPACFQTYELTLESKDDKTICSTYCGGTKSLCKLLRFDYTRKGGENVLFKCVNIPIDTDFVFGADGNCIGPPSFQNIKFEHDKPILEGTYYFYPIYTGKLYPEVCVFKIMGGE